MPITATFTSITISAGETSPKLASARSDLASLWNVHSAVPSGLFPSAQHRPRFREPHPVRVPAVIVGAATTLGWQILVSLFATSVRGLLTLLLMAAAVATAVAAALLRFGDRGVAVGVGLAATMGGCAAAAVAAVRWLTVGWPL
jgi:hypothetical protein